MASLQTTSASCLGCVARRSLTTTASRPTLSIAPAAATANAFLTLQTRGKKTRRKEQGVVVRLLEDVSHFGRRDTILRVERGRMRNMWYPKRIAEYMTLSRLAELGVKAGDAVVPPDPYFISKKDGAEEIDETTELFDAPRATISLRTISPARAANLLETLLPPTLVFHRKPISADTTAIFGSVSADDVATALREVLQASQDSDALLVRVEPRDVRFIVPASEEAHQPQATPSRQGADELDQSESTADRVKALGRWEVEITMRNSHGSHGSAGDLAKSPLAAAAAAAVGAGNGVPPVRKVVEVLAQE